MLPNLNEPSLAQCNLTWPEPNSYKIKAFVKFRPTYTAGTLIVINKIDFILTQNIYGQSFNVIQCLPHVEFF